MAIDQALATLVAPIVTLVAGSVGTYYATRTKAQKDARHRYRGFAEHEPDLTAFVCEPSDERHTFYASVGVADSFVPWIRRLFHDSDKTPPIKEIFVKTLSDETAQTLQNLGYVDAGFIQSLKTQLADLSNDENIQSAGTTILVRHWQKLPPFQGYLFNGCGFTGRWQINRVGKLDAKGPIERYSQKDLKQRYEEELKAIREL